MDVVTLITLSEVIGITFLCTVLTAMVCYWIHTSYKPVTNGDK